MKEQLGKFDAAGLSFVQEALDAAGIEYVVRDDTPPAVYSPASGRMVDGSQKYDVLVEAERLANAKAAVERWHEEAAEAVMRESGAPPPSPEELAADAEWERQKAADKAERSSPVSWRVLIIVGVAVGGGLLALILAGH